MSKTADMIRQDRIDLVSKLSPFVSTKWVLEKMGLSIPEITACDESLKKKFIKKISDPSIEITKEDKETLKIIYENGR